MASALVEKRDRGQRIAGPAAEMWSAAKLRVWDFFVGREEGSFVGLLVAFYFLVCLFHGDFLSAAQDDLWIFSAHMASPTGSVFPILADTSARRLVHCLWLCERFR